MRLLLLPLLCLAACTFDRGGLAIDPSSADLTADSASADLSTDSPAAPDSAPTDLPRPDAAGDADRDAADAAAVDAADGAADGPLSDLPVPDAATPDAPLPDLLAPDLALPDFPVPDLALPDFPVPDLPLPDLALPDLPVPDLPVPDLPPPDLPPPDLPVPDQASPLAGDAMNDANLAYCAAKYGTAPDYVLCWVTPSGCAFNANTNGNDCNAMCQSLGGTCLAAWDNPNDPGDECVILGSDPCSQDRGTNICLCSK